MEKKHTIFCDIDGSIFKYRKFETYTTSEAEVLPEVISKLDQWKKEGHRIILTTARPKDLYMHTVVELSKNGVSYDDIIMGIERGPRVLINDMDPEKEGLRAIGINLIRNEGFENVDWSEYGL